MKITTTTFVKVLQNKNLRLFNFIVSHITNGFSGLLESFDKFSNGTIIIFNDSAQILSKITDKYPDLKSTEDVINCLKENPSLFLKIRSFLLYHISQYQNITSSVLNVPSLDGELLSLSMDTVNDHRVLRIIKLQNNTLVYIIDSILVPPSFQQEWVI